MYGTALSALRRPFERALVALVHTVDALRASLAVALASAPAPRLPSAELVAELRDVAVALVATRAPKALAFLRAHASAFAMAMLALTPAATRTSKVRNFTRHRQNRALTNHVPSRHLANHSHHDSWRATR